MFAMGYMSAIHIYRQIYDYGNYTLDITGLVMSFIFLLLPVMNLFIIIYINRPLMISTQKLTALAFAFHDGSKREEDLSEDQKSQAIK